MNATLETQPALFVTRQDKAERDVRWLESSLAAAGSWRTATEILVSIGWPVNEGGKRWLRDLASQSNVILSGQRGYLHAGKATAEEVSHSSNWLISQGKEMIKRGISQRRAAHAILG